MKNANHKIFCAVTLSAAFALAVASGCTNPAVQNAANTANTDAKVAVTAIASACQYAPLLLSIAQATAKGGAANTVADTADIVGKSCTVAGQAALAANDQSPIGPSNSGNSAAWLLTTAASALAVAADAPVTHTVVN